MYAIRSYYVADQITEFINGGTHGLKGMVLSGGTVAHGQPVPKGGGVYRVGNVITSYSIHYTKLYDEIGEAQLPPEQFGGVQRAGDELDRFGTDGAVKNRPRARIGRHADAEPEFHSSPLIIGSRRYVVTCDVHHKAFV